MALKKFEKELEAYLKGEFGVSKKAADQIVNKLEAFIKNEIEEGNTVVWTGFLKIEPAIQKARDGRNPATGESIQIPEKKTVRVKVSPAWRRKINE